MLLLSLITYLTIGTLSGITNEEDFVVQRLTMISHLDSNLKQGWGKWRQLMMTMWIWKCKILKKTLKGHFKGPVKISNESVEEIQ